MFGEHPFSSQPYSRNSSTFAAFATLLFGGFALGRSHISTHFHGLFPWDACDSAALGGGRTKLVHSASEVGPGEYTAEHGLVPAGPTAKMLGPSAGRGLRWVGFGSQKITSSGYKCLSCTYYIIL